MNRLQLELRRLYAPETGASSEAALNLVDPARGVRALVLELTRPASWDALGKVWHGVQAALELPAPAIAVSGVDGLQLWFSLAEPVAASEAHRFLDALVARFLPDVAPKRLRLWPATATAAHQPALHARPVPAEQGASGNWSAFIAPDLAPVFADTPWLDIPPGEEGQTNLLRGLQSIRPAAFETAWALLAPVAAERSATRDGWAQPSPAPVEASAGARAAGDDPRRFLRQVMNDEAVPLALRIDAAKALLSAPGESPAGIADRS